MKTEILWLDHVSLSHGGMNVLNHVNMSLFEGEIMGIVGTNGAGKTSLARVVAGYLKPKSGRIFYRGSETTWENFLQAIDNGICYLGQEQSFAENMTVAENILMGRRKKMKELLHQREMNVSARTYADEAGLDVDLGLFPGDITYAQRQLLGIARALACRVSVLILDNPTLFLTDSEIDYLNGVLKRLKKNGVSVVYISHKLGKVLEVSDSVLVLRDGICVARGEAEGYTEKSLLSIMIGSERAEPFSIGITDAAADGVGKEVLLSAKGLSLAEYFEDISFSLSRGEVLSIYGTVGCGKSRIVEVLFGMRGGSGGEIYIKGRRAVIRSVKDAHRMKMGLIPQKREHDGIIDGFNVIENISLASVGKITVGGVMKRDLEYSLASYYCDMLRIAPSLWEEKAARLDVCTRLKAGIAKELAMGAEILVMDEPTQGFDYFGREEFYKVISEIRKNIGILIVSSEAENTVQILDRMLVMEDGGIARELSREECLERSAGYGSRY